MVTKLGGADDTFLSYRTGEYKLHYYETPTRMKFVMLTDTKVPNLRQYLYQIWANLYVEYVVKNPLAPTEHPGGVGISNELFERGLEAFLGAVLPSTSRDVAVLGNTQLWRHECWRPSRFRCLHLSVFVEHF